MDRRERVGDPLAAMLVVLEGKQSELWTALPGIVQSFNASKRTVTVQPTLRARVQATDGSFSWVQMPVLLDCPVFYPGGGGCTLTFPIAANDECLVVFASRCIDAWWQSGGIQNQAELRMHDLSDGFAFVGVQSVPNVIPSISTSTTQLRSNDGAAYVEVNPSTHALRAITSGAATVTGASITLNGPVTINGNVTLNGTMSSTGDISAAGKSLDSHTHNDPQGGVTSGPN